MNNNLLKFIKGKTNKLKAGKWKSMKCGVKLVTVCAANQNLLNALHFKLNNLWIVMFLYCGVSRNEQERIILVSTFKSSWTYQEIHAKGEFFGPLPQNWLLLPQNFHKIFTQTWVSFSLTFEHHLWSPTKPNQLLAKNEPSHSYKWYLLFQKTTLKLFLSFFNSTSASIILFKSNKNQNLSITTNKSIWSSYETCNTKILRQIYLQAI